MSCASRPSSRNKGILLQSQWKMGVSFCFVYRQKSGGTGLGCCFLDSGDMSRTGCRDEAQPVRQRRVVDESVSDHFSVMEMNKMELRTPKVGGCQESNAIVHKKKGVSQSVIDRRMEPEDRPRLISCVWGEIRRNNVYCIYYYYSIHGI